MGSGEVTGSCLHTPCHFFGCFLFLKRTACPTLKQLLLSTLGSAYRRFRSILRDVVGHTHATVELRSRCFRSNPCKLPELISSQTVTTTIYHWCGFGRQCRHHLFDGLGAALSGLTALRHRWLAAPLPTATTTYHRVHFVFRRCFVLTVVTVLRSF